MCDGTVTACDHAVTMCDGAVTTGDCAVAVGLHWTAQPLPWPLAATVLFKARQAVGPRLLSSVLWDCPQKAACDPRWVGSMSVGKWGVLDQDHGCSLPGACCFSPSHCYVSGFGVTLGPSTGPGTLGTLSEAAIPDSCHLVWALLFFPLLPSSPPAPTPAPHLLRPPAPSSSAAAPPAPPS